MLSSLSENCICTQMGESLQPASCSLLNQCRPVSKMDQSHSLSGNSEFRALGPHSEAGRLSPEKSGVSGHSLPWYPWLPPGFLLALCLLLLSLLCRLIILYLSTLSRCSLRLNCVYVSLLTFSSFPRQSNLVHGFNYHLYTNDSQLYVKSPDLSLTLQTRASIDPGYFQLKYLKLNMSKIEF